MTAPGVPTNFNVTVGNGQTYLEWDLTATATSYIIQTSTDGVSYSTLASPTVPFYLDTTAAVGVLKYYKVAGVNGSGTGTYTSAILSATTYSGNMTLGQVRTLAQYYSDMVNNTFITNAEWSMYINQSYFELYDILVQKFGDEYFLATPYQFLTTGAQFYSLPDGSSTYPTTPTSGITARPFYKLKGIDLALNSNINSWISLHKFNFISRNRYIFPNLTSTFMGVVNLRYRLMGSQIEFIPTPSASQFIQVWYVPRMVQLLSDNDMLDGISGWTDYVAVDAAIKALTKEESDVTVLMNRKMALLTRIEEAAENRDAGIPDTISDTRRYTDIYGVGSPNGDGPSGGF